MTCPECGYVESCGCAKKLRAECERLGKDNAELREALHSPKGLADYSAQCREAGAREMAEYLARDKFSRNYPPTETSVQNLAGLYFLAWREQRKKSWRWVMDKKLEAIKQELMDLLDKRVEKLSQEDYRNFLEEFLSEVECRFQAVREELGEFA